MQIDITRDELSALREVLQEKVSELDREINRADSLRYKEELRGTERVLERILGRLNEPSPDATVEWEPRDAVSDEDRGGHS